ncbi:MAG: Gldg family protein [Pseudobdellovibrio sp.]
MSKKGQLFIGAAFILLICWIGMYFALQVWMPFMWFILAPALLCMIAWIYLDRRIIIDFFTMRTTKHGLNMGVLVLIAFIFLAAFNILAVKINKTFDYSTEKLHTLSPLTLKILSSLDNNLNVKFFYKEGTENLEASRKAFTQMVSLYQEQSSKLKVEYIEMNANPKTTLEYGANKPQGEAFVEYQGQKNRIESQFLGSLGQKYNEQDFTNAIIKVTRKSKKNVYFVEGHQERDFESETNESGVFAFKQLLEKNSFNVKKLNFIQTPSVPQDADVLVILGPKTPYQKFEIDLILQYLNQGGSLFLTFDDKNAAGLDILIDKFGLKLDQHYVFNVLNTPMGQVVNSTQPTVAVDYSATSPITSVFSSNQSAIFIKPNSLSQTKTVELIKGQIIVKTPEASVALKNLDSSDYEGKPQSYNLMTEITGKLAAESKDFKAVVVADTDFLSNTVISQNVNRDIALNSISQLVNETDLISIAPKELSITKMKMSPPEFSYYYKFLVMGIFLPLPFLFLIISVALWLKRRYI